MLPMITQLYTVVIQQGDILAVFLTTTAILRAVTLNSPLFTLSKHLGTPSC